MKLSNVILTNKYISLSWIQSKRSNLSNDSVNSNYTQTSFSGMKNPVRKLTREKYVKELYKYYSFNRRNISYLHPDETYSDEAVNNIIVGLIKPFEKLVEQKNVNIESLQKLVDKHVPSKASGTIMVKDFESLHQDWIKKGVSKNIIETYLGSSDAIANSYYNETTIYLKFNQLPVEPSHSRLKRHFLHEMKHAVSRRLQNEYNSLQCNIEKYGEKYLDLFNDIFVDFENSVLPKFNILGKETKLPTRHDFLSNLHNAFEEKLSEKLEFDDKQKASEFANNKQLQKMFFVLMKQDAKDEKEAYLTGRMVSQSNQPFVVYNNKILPFYYGEMEKFFAKKAHEVVLD